MRKTTSRSEARKAGAVDIFIGDDLNIEFRLDNVDDDLHGLDSIDSYGMYGPECRGGGEDTIAYEKKLRWLQLLKDSNCTVTSTWTNNEDNQNREFHMWRAWESRVRKGQLDYVMGPKDIRSTTWYLNQVKLRTWHHFPVITRIEGRELKTRKCVKSWAGWTPPFQMQKKSKVPIALSTE